MGFWLPAIAVLILTLFVMAAALRLRPENVEETQEQSDEIAAAKQFYALQLDELKLALANNNLTEDAFAAAKLELDRELLRRSKNANSNPTARRQSPLFMALPLFLIVAVSVGGYFYLGNPSLSDRPLAERIASGENLNIDQALERIEAHLAATPDDLQGWRVIAPIYARKGDFESAANAFTQIIRLESETADNLTDLAEVLLSLREGNMDEEIDNLLVRAGNLDPNHVRSRFYLAAEATRVGENDKAVALWEKLISLADGNEPWLATARAGLARASGQEVTAGPTDEQVQAASELNAEERQSMIVDMVEGLQTRLYDEGGSPAEWAQLLRAMVVIGNVDEAKVALEKARAQFKDDEPLLNEFQSRAQNDILTIEGN